VNRKRTNFIFLMIIVLSIIILGLIQTDNSFAYNACRNVAMKTKGYAVWKYVSSIEKTFQSVITFSDGYNSLDCYAMGFGSSWRVIYHSKTYVECSLSLEDTHNPCPEDYFGVEP